MAQARLDALRLEKPKYIYANANTFNVKVHGTAPSWLHEHIMTTAPENAVQGKYEVNLKMTDIRTGKATFKELQPALDARLRIVQIKQAAGPTQSIFLQLVWILKHLQWQQPEGQVTAPSVISQLCAAHAQAAAGAEWDLLIWARSYCNSPALPFVRYLSQQILKFANPSAADENTQGQHGDAMRSDDHTLPNDSVLGLLSLPSLDGLTQDEALLTDTDEWLPQDPWKDADQAGSGEAHLLSAPSSTLSNAGLFGVPAAVHSDAEPHDCTPARNKLAASQQHVTALHGPVLFELGTQHAIIADSRGLPQSVSDAAHTYVPEQSASVHAIDTVSLDSKRGFHDEPGSSQSDYTEHVASKRSRLQTAAEVRQEAQAPRPSDMVYSETAFQAPRLNMLQGAYATFGQQGQLIGREDLQAQLAAMLKDPVRRNTVLVGGPGMGKTSLAIACAQAMHDAQDLDCIYAASLRGISSVEGAFAEIRQTIDQGQGRSRTLHTPAQAQQMAFVTQQLCQLLRIHAQQKVLLILDNADSVIGRKEFQSALSQLQARLSNVTLLSTSRQLPLFVDMPRQTLKLQPLVQEEAQRLLCHVCPQLIKEEPCMAEQLAKQCGNIPIALKVVASMIEQHQVTAQPCVLRSSMKIGHEAETWGLVNAASSLVHLCSLLQDMVQTLAKMGLIRGAEQLGDDDRLLRDCITLSLSSVKSEQARLAQLSIFPAAFDAEAAAAILNLDQIEAKSTLGALGRRSLVSEEAVMPRRSQKQQYILHLLIRDLSAEGAEGQADYVSAQHRFTRYFLDLWLSAKADTEESQHRLQLQRQNVAKAVELLAAQQQPLAGFQAYCNLGEVALDSVYNARLNMPTVIAALSKLRTWAQAANEAEATLSSREQLAYLQSRNAKEAKNARDELQQIQTERTAASGSNSASLTLCLEGLANAAVTMRCNGQLTVDEADAFVDECREEKYHILKATCGETCAATLRAAGWVAYGLLDTDDSIEQLSIHLESATETLTACHPATFAIQSQFAQQLSQGTHGKMCSCAALCKQLLASEQQNFDDDPKRVILAWLDHHAKQCEERLTSLADETVLAILSLGTAMTRCTRPEQQQTGLRKVCQGMKLGEQCWGKNDEWLLDSRLGLHVTALQRLWQLDKAIAIVKDTLQLSKQAFGETTTYITECMQLEAELLQRQGKYLEAQTVLEKAAQHHLEARQGPSNQNGSNMSLLLSGIPLDLAINLSLQGRHKEASGIHGFAYKILASNAANQCDIFSRHCLGMATAWRHQGNFTNAKQLLQQAEKHHIQDDCDASKIALEQARWQRDSGQVNAALVQLKELYSYLLQCDGDTKLVAIEAALEAAWLYFLDHQFIDAQWWFTEADCIVLSLPRESCNLLAAVSSSGLAAVQLQAQTVQGAIATTITYAESVVRQPHAYAAADGCQTAHLYLAICNRMLGNSDKAQQHYADAMHALSEMYAQDHVYAISCENVYRQFT